MKAFSEEFYQKLVATIEDVEEDTSVEIVVAASPASGKYTYVPMIFAFIMSMVILTFIMFTPVTIPDVLFTPITIFTFILFFFVFNPMVFIKRWFSGHKRKVENARKNAQAFFTESGMVNTIDRTGFLCYLSFLESEAVIIPDKGVIEKVPREDLIKIKQQFQAVFQAKDVEGSILKAIKFTEPIFASYLPPIGENPDELDNQLIILKGGQENVL